MVLSTTDADVLDPIAKGQGTTDGVRSVFPDLTEDQYNYLHLLAEGVALLTPEN